MIAAGQKITVPPGAYARLHVLGAGDTGSVTVPAVLSYADGSTAAIFHQTAVLDPTKQLAAVSLMTPAGGSARAHIFALSLESVS